MEKKRVHLIFGKLRRDYPYCKALAEELERYGMETSIGSHWEKKSIIQASDAAFVFSFLPSIPNLCRFLRHIASERKAKIGVHPHEGFQNYRTFSELIGGINEKRMGSFAHSQDMNLEYVSRFYFWGAVHLAEWAPLLVSQRRLPTSSIRAYGTIYHDYSVRPRDPKRAGKIRRVLYCTGSSAIADYTDADFENAKDLLPDSSFAKEKKLDILRSARLAAVDDRKENLKAFLGFVRKNGKIQFKVRFHPVEAEMVEAKRSNVLVEFAEEIESLPNAAIMPTNRRINAEKLTSCDLVIHQGSTVGLQASLYGVPNLLLPLRRLSKLHEGLKSYAPFVASLECDTAIRSSDLMQLNVIDMEKYAQEQFDKQLEKNRYAKAFFYGEQNNGHNPCQSIALDIINVITDRKGGIISLCGSTPSPELGTPISQEMDCPLENTLKIKTGNTHCSPQEVSPYPDEFNRLIPKTFAVETILGCSLMCPECAIGGNFITRKKGWMKFDQFKTIADKIRPFCKHLYLHIWGEPMLNKDIFEMIKYASAFTTTNISTNGNSLTEENAEKLITSGVTEIIVSIDGVSQEVYGKYRVGGNVKKATETLKMIQRFNLKYGKKVNIMPQFIVMKHNQHEMNEFRELCESLQLVPTFKSPYIRNESSRFAVSDNPRFVRPHFADIESLREGMTECPSVRNVFNILLDGSVVLCCHDYDKFTHFGNVFEQEVMEIWNSNKFRTARWNVMSGNAPKFCIEKCMSYYLGNVHTHKTDMKQMRVAKTGERISDSNSAGLKINLCSGTIKIHGYINIDLFPASDIVLDLENKLLPLPDESADIVACNSAINYFSNCRAGEIIKDVYRVLKPGGIVRFGTQDLHTLAEKYLNEDSDFYFEKLPDGRDRFPGKTFGDKLNEFFYGFHSGGGKHCKYVYDFQSLKILFVEAGFSDIQKKAYHESLIPEIDKIDNRPEQMFFLEAIKGNMHNEPSEMTSGETGKMIVSGVLNQGGVLRSLDPSTIRQRALSMWETGYREESWQLFMVALETKPDDRVTVLKCADILTGLEQFEDLQKLCENYLKEQPEDTQIQHLAHDAANALKRNRIDEKEVQQKRLRLNSLYTKINEIRSDEEHLAGCLRWLRKAQTIHPGGGVSSLYHMDSEQWGPDYPETTGYIIPTFICYYKFTGDETYLDWAIEMGDWEVAIQRTDGGIGEPIGVYGQRPRVFNTSQVILGWAALFRQTGQSKYLNAAQKAGNWILDRQDPDGKWTQNTYSGPKAYMGRVAWALLELFSITGEERFRSAAEGATQWVVAQGNSNGWFRNNSLSEQGKPWTHLIGYVLVGLLRTCQLNNSSPYNQDTMSILKNASEALSSFYIKLKENVSNGSFITLPGTFDDQWLSSDSWSCITGNAQIGFFLKEMNSLTKIGILGEASDSLLDDLKHLHFINDIDDPNLYGSLPGCYPVGMGCYPYSIPNWGVKFFADCLLQRLLPRNDQICLG